MKKFVFANEKIVLKNETIEKYEIGIVEKSNKSTVLVQFVNIESLVELPLDKVVFFNPIETGDNFAYKICNRCNRILPVSSFQKNQNGIDNRKVRRPSCNSCRLEIDGIKVSANDKQEWSKIKPNFEIWECPVCKKKTIPGLTSKVVLDHNHKTGRPRAWICDSCNTGLGRFKDDVKTIKNAIEYLESSENN